MSFLLFPPRRFFIHLSRPISPLSIFHTVISAAAPLFFFFLLFIFDLFLISLSHSFYPRVSLLSSALFLRSFIIHYFISDETYEVLSSTPNTIGSFISRPEPRHETGEIPDSRTVDDLSHESQFHSEQFHRPNCTF